jgi:hypothetical protein
VTIRRERFHATWVVEFQDGPEGITPLLPVAPSTMAQVIAMTARRLLDQAGSDAELYGAGQPQVGAVTVVSMADPDWPRLPLVMIPLPSGRDPA